MWSSNHFIAEWNKGMKHITNGVTWIKSLQASDPNDWIFIIAKIKWRHTVEVMVVVLLMFQDGVMSAPMWWRGQHRTAKARMTSTAWTMASACCWWTWINTTASTVLCVCVRVLLLIITCDHEWLVSLCCRCERGYSGLRCGDPELVFQPQGEEQIIVTIFCVSLLIIGLSGALYFCCKW